MPDDVAYTVDPVVHPRQVTDLRAAVGWERQDADYPAAFAGYWATVGGFAPSGALVAWCALLSDGVRHAALLDVIVHPAWQRRGVGRALVARSVAHCLERGVTIIHVDFLPEHAPFYERCGFRTGLGGIYERRGAAR